MGSLLDQVFEKLDSPSADLVLNPTDDKPHQALDGSTVYSSTLAAIARILALNPHLHKRATGDQSKPYQLYNGHVAIDLKDQQTFFSLLKADWKPRSRYQMVFLIDKVTELAPVFSKDCQFIPPDLLWDRDSATLRRMSDEELTKLRTVS